MESCGIFHQVNSTAKSAICKPTQPRGAYRSSSYRAYVTDLSKTVVLRYERRTAVVSPDQPEDFVREVMEPLMHTNTH